MTEIEARKKMCPWGREWIYRDKHLEGPAYNIVVVNMVDGRPIACCITTKCMAWEEIDDTHGDCALINK